MLSSAYGIDVKSRRDSYTVKAEKVADCLARAGILGTYLVDYFPSLKYLPSWFPGAQFKRDAEVWVEYVRELPDAGFQIAKQDFVRIFFPFFLRSRDWLWLRTFIRIDRKKGMQRIVLHRVL